MTENERFLAVRRGLYQVVNDPTRSRADRVKARDALRALTSTVAGSVLRKYSGDDRPEVER